MGLKTFRRKTYLALRKLRGQQTDEFAPHGVPVTVPASADLAIAYLLAKGRPYEAEEAELINKYLKPGTSVIELGGCFGVVSALIRSKIGPDAKHMVVEANPRLLDILTKNAQRGAAADATKIVHAAVDYSGAESVSFSLGHNAHVGRLGGGGTEVVAKTTQLKTLEAELPEGDYALVCDIEGAELQLAAAPTEDLSRVSMMVLETHPKFYAQGQTDLDTLLETLRGKGLVVQEHIRDVYFLSRA